MKKITKSTVPQTVESSYGLRQRSAAATKQNDSKTKKSKLAIKKADSNEATSKPITRKSSGVNKNNLIKESPAKKLTVLSTKIRPQRIKKLTEVSTPKSKQLDQQTPNTRNSKKINKSTGTKKLKTTNKIESKTSVKDITVRLEEPVISRSDEIIKKRGRPKKLTVVASTIRPKINKQFINASTPKTSITRNGKQISELAVETKEANTIYKTPSKSITPKQQKIPTVQLERLNKRLERLYTNKIENNKQNEINSTPQNKDVSIRNISERPTRVLRKRNQLISNKYKDCSLISPSFMEKSEKPATPNPLAVYEFEFDPLDEPVNKQKKYVSESSGEDDNEMKNILKRLRKKHKKVSVKNKKVNKKQKTAKAQNKAEPLNKQSKIVSNSETKQDHVVKQMKQTEVAEKQLSVPDKQIKPITVVEKQLPSTEKQTKSTIPEENQNNLFKPEIIHKLPEITINSVEMVSISDDNSDYSDLLDPIPPIDPSIEARNIVEEVTKSFIDDLSDEESNISPGKIKIHSNVAVRKSKTYKKKKIFNSTTNGLKPSRPWRIDVSAIRKTPYIFTYKDKSFTPRYEPEIVTLNINNILKEKDTDKNQENIKPTFQTSILDFVNGSKPKIIENKNNGLFNDLPQKLVQSPRKVLGEINFIQSTPLKPINNNVLNSPNISFIKPKNKSADSMFGFSYFSDESENKENIRKSPRKSPKKLKQKTTNPVVEIVKETVPIINSSDQNTNKKVNKIVKEENLTLTESEIFVVPTDSDLSIALFQDVDNGIEVLKKSTRKYVRKYPKRKRLPSVDTVPSDDESEAEQPEKKKRKQKNVRTKQEEQEADRLAAHYNSMFEEMEKYPLIIE